MPNPAMIPLLTVRARVEETWLLVDYQVFNRGSEPVLTYDADPGEPGQEYPDMTDHLGVFVSFREPATLQVKRMLGKPVHSRVTIVRIPAVYLLEPGGSRAVRFKLPVPVTEKSEFCPPFDGATYVDRRATTLEMHVGWMTLPPGSTLQPFTATPQAFKVKGIHGPQEIVVASTSLPVPARVRTDPQFHRA